MWSRARGTRASNCGRLRRGAPPPTWRHFTQSCGTRHAARPPHMPSSVACLQCSHVFPKRNLIHDKLLLQRKVRDVKYCRQIGRLGTLSADGNLMLWDAQLRHVRTVRCSTSQCSLQQILVGPNIEILYSGQLQYTFMIFNFNLMELEVDLSLPVFRPVVLREPPALTASAAALQAPLQYATELVCLAMDDSAALAVGSQSHVTLLDARQPGAVHHISSVEPNSVRLRCRVLGYMPSVNHCRYKTHESYKHSRN